MLQFQLLKLFTLRVEVYAADFSLDLVEANVVEALEARTRYGTNTVVRNQEMLLPPHKYMLSLGGVSNSDGAFACLFLKGAESGEFGPMAQIDLHISTPVVVLGEKTVLSSNNLAFEICGEGWMIFGQALNTQVSAKERLAHVHMLDLDLNIVDLSLRLLSPVESTAGT